MAMSELTEKLNLIIAKAAEEGTFDEGDRQGFVCNDAIVILSFEDNQFKIDVLAGEPTIMDLSLNILNDE